MLLGVIALRSMAFASETVETFTIDGVERKATVVGSTANSASGKAPLVLVFHGHGGNMRYSVRKFQIHKLWPEAVVVYPEGLPAKGMSDPNGLKNGWQQKAGDDGDRDLKFVDAILARMHKEYSIDDSRIYSMGHSNGGRFTYLLWKERGDVFAAYGPAASPMVMGVKPQSAFVIAGEKDPIVPFVSQKFSINRLRKILDVGGTPLKDGYATYEKGPDGLELGTYVFPGGHEYPDEAAKLTVDFFKRHPKLRR